MKTKWIIEDWAGNLMEFKNRPTSYKSFDDAEEVLSEELDENYNEDRGEYVITETEDQ